MRLESEMYQTIPPLFQPLRLWSSKPVPAANAIACRSTLPVIKRNCARIFSMRGGYITIADGERRLIIAGKLFRTREQS